MIGDLRVALLADAGMGEHNAPGHPERPERLDAVAAGVADGAHRAGLRLDRPTFDPASDEELERIHAPWYVAALGDAAKRGGGWLDADTYLGPSSMTAARLAAGATIAAARLAAAGEALVAFAVVRPPGHHAARERPAGFCLLNNVALAVAALRAEGFASRLAIVDWDVHHGDGTQEIFDTDPDLCYASTHQSPLYPGSGSATEQGSGPAAGTKHNRPLPPATGDAQMIAAWRDDLLPAIAAFAPEAILVSCGYDAHAADPLAGLEVTDTGYRMIAAELGLTAAGLGLRGVALTLEGGYDLRALRSAAAATVDGLVHGWRSAVAQL
jgi:acetoin utilization deacetylase AcuC-like enzyme